MPLAPPPRDKGGQVVAHDHSEILAADGLIRRISAQLIVDDKRRGCKRISSMAFRGSSGVPGGMSVDLQSEIEKAGLDAREYVTTPRWIGSVRFVVRDLRNLGFQVGFHPIEMNPYHGEVWGEFNRAQQIALQELCAWFVEIPEVSVR